MEYRRLGASELKVSEVGLGCNNFGWLLDEATSIDVIDHAVEMGITFLDTADMYGQGLSEEFVGKAVRRKRSEVVIATKFGYPMGDDPRDQGASRGYIHRAADSSLKRLGTDYIDLYQVHLPDPSTPLDETLRALDELVQAGKVRLIGCSNFTASQICEALETSVANGLAPFQTAQARYNLLERDIEEELVDCCQTNKVSIIPWGPLAGGFLTGKYRRAEETPLDSRLADAGPLSNPYRDVRNEANLAKLANLIDFAEARGHTVAELAISWLLSKPVVGTVIFGARSREQVTANLAAAGWKLSESEVAEAETLAART
jgi:aryl-alcohol dehydrogenase-like predicted oxidoreductase